MRSELNVVLISSNFKQGGAIVITEKNGHKKKSAKVAAVSNIYVPCHDLMCEAPAMFIPFSKPL